MKFELILYNKDNKIIKRFEDDYSAFNLLKQLGGSYNDVEHLKYDDAKLTYLTYYLDKVNLDNWKILYNKEVYKMLLIKLRKLSNFVSIARQEVKYNGGKLYGRNNGKRTF